MGTPPWADQTNSWAKLEAIHAWLDHQGDRSDPFWRVEGRLQLAEGRMEFYRAELAQLEPGVSQQRLVAARADFLRVQSDPLATEGQVRRAQRGLAYASPASAAPVRTTSLPPGVLPRSAWGARPVNRSKVTPANAPWRHITIHHSTSKDSPAVLATASGAKSDLQRIQKYHMTNNGWGDVGYHFLIDAGGRIYEGRSMEFQGAHAGTDGASNNNVGNIGICLLGNFDEERPTPAALRSLEQLVRNLRSTYSIPSKGVSAHLDWKNTECPGQYLLPYVRQLARS